MGSLRGAHGRSRTGVGRGMKCADCPVRNAPTPCHQDLCTVVHGATRVYAVRPNQPQRRKPVIMTFKKRLAIGLAAWLFLVVYVFLAPTPAHGAGAPAGAMPGASQHDPGEWYVDANALFRYSVAQLHNKGQVLTASDQTAARARCLSVATEYNKRSARVKVGGKAPVVKGKDADGPHNGMRIAEDFFEKRGLPRTLDASECTIRA